ncbi:apolipoprotein D and lipocalin family protein [Pseudomonas sp. SJZ080]|uniref:lipocalin family protein n=2 Tax=Pseudomonas TaxID=286 RepID=UPI0011992B4F|nr:lipocalin family protein [Pseudomonas sp. SJZ080]TWC22223.1 apolipoprotein D and lipocalin family protein [Pseudomonas sp. SJZ083]TWC45045.1 apolipoprotein D and lipocalin family protein [Pseudomonas sp. SJZ080]TWC48792.1 apolipoprotein D and lipocalin family protein [Pseudomonas sp. SJZ077]
MRRLLPYLFTGLLWAGLSFTASAVQADSSSLPLQPVASIDLPRFMGTWYEIARSPNRFQKRCAGFTRTDFHLQADGTVQAVNRCRLHDGQLHLALATGRQVGAPDSPRLKVRFAPAWMSFLPSVWGDYWIIDLDAQYQLVAVSEPTRKYLWILSRTTRVEPQAYAALLERLKDKGFAVERLLMTQQ